MHVSRHPSQFVRLIVTDAGDGDNSDHADWADAKIPRPRPPGGAPPRAPPRPQRTRPRIRLAIAESLNVAGGRERRLLSGLRTGVSTPRSR
jgi:hypothetical protein